MTRNEYELKKNEILKNYEAKHNRLIIEKNDCIAKLDEQFNDFNDVEFVKYQNEYNDKFILVELKSGNFTIIHIDEVTSVDSDFIKYNGTKWYFDNNIGKPISECFYYNEQKWNDDNKETKSISVSSKKGNGQIYIKCITKCLTNAEVKEIFDNVKKEFYDICDIGGV